MGKKPKRPKTTPTGRVTRAEKTRAISRIANTQGGAVGDVDLRALGISRKQVTSRVAEGSLVDLNGGVYAVGHRVLSENGWRHAALLCAGSGSALSHWAAAILWGLTDRRKPTIDVSTRSRSDREACQSVVIHRPRKLPSSDISSLAGLRLTTIFRTLMDLAPLVDDAEMRRMVEMAFTKHHISPVALAAYARRHRSWPGVRRLVAGARAAIGSVETKSTLEIKFRTFCEERGLPLYDANVPFQDWVIDGLWVPYGVALELDTYRWHGAQSNYRIDRKKGMAIERAGIHLIRVAGEDLEDDPDDVYETVLAVLQRHAPTGSDAALDATGPATSTTPASTTPASTTPASTTPASTTPASTTPASTTPASTTAASTTPASTTPTILGSQNAQKGPSWSPR